MVIGCWGRGQYRAWYKFHGLPWQIINGQGPLADTLYCSHPHKFTEVKGSFFISQSNSGPCLFHFISHSWRPSRVVKVIKSMVYNKREREIFWFSLSERKFWNIVQWCHKCFERLWEHFASKVSETRSVGEEVSMLHPYRMESYLIPPVSMIYFIITETLGRLKTETEKSSPRRLFLL